MEKPRQTVRSKSPNAHNVDVAVVPIQDEPVGETAPLVTSKQSQMRSSDRTKLGSSAQKNQSVYTCCLIVTTLAAVISSSAQFGYGTGVMNNPRLVIISSLQPSANCSVDFTENRASGSAKNLYDLATSVFCLGGLLGSVVGGRLADRIGRKYSLLFNNVIAAAMSTIFALSNSFAMLIAGRAVQGLNSGIAMVVVSAYLGEISPVSARGAIGAVNQFFVTFAILISTVLGLPELLGDCHRWHYLLAFPVVFVFLQLITLPFCPQSPPYLFLYRHDEDGAVKALQRLRGLKDVSEDIGALEAEKEKQKSLSEVTIVGFFRDKYLRRPLLIIVGLHMSQQLTGINGVFYYGKMIFETAGLSNPSVVAVIPTIVNVAMTGVVVNLVDRLGRRTLMLHGLGIMFVSYIVTTIGFCFQDGYFHNVKGSNWTGVFSVGGALGVVIGFSIGPGPIPWLIVAELFPQNARALATSVAGVVNWLCNYVIGQFFRIMLTNTQPYGMLVFAASSAIFVAFTYLHVPETKGRSVDEIQAYFHNLVDLKKQRRPQP